MVPLSLKPKCIGPGVKGQTWGHLRSPSFQITYWRICAFFVLDCGIFNVWGRRASFREYTYVSSKLEVYPRSCWTWHDLTKRQRGVNYTRYRVISLDYQKESKFLQCNEGWAGRLWLKSRGFAGCLKVLQGPIMTVDGKVGNTANIRAVGSSAA
jgi:hypothetical protein